jgi:hypothetical protein
MDKSPKISPTDTYIFDDEDIEQLDELSLTSVMRDASGLQKKLSEQLEESEEADDASSGLDDLEFGVLMPDD